MFSRLREAIDDLVWPNRPRPRMGLAEIACPDPADPSAEPGIMCRPGEDVVCDGPEQHIICTACDTIEMGETPDPGKVHEQFFWFQPPPAVGTKFLDIKCNQCDGRWVSSGMHLHFKGGWR